MRGRFLLTSSIVHALGVVVVTAVHARELQYLKEIIQGRCYDQPPSTKMGPDSCPEVVGSIMNALESKKDADIQPSDFSTYLSKEADFSSPKNKGIFVVHFMGEDGAGAFLPPAGFVTPEDTAGGGLLKDLTFCGIDQRDNNCKKESSNAYWTFWEAAYASFASQVKGHFQIVIEHPFADISFLQRKSILKALEMQRQEISSITVYGGSESETLEKLLTALKEEARIENVSWKENISDLFLDSSAAEEDEDSSPEEEESGSRSSSAHQEYDDNADSNSNNNHTTPQDEDRPLSPHATIPNEHHHNTIVIFFFLGLFVLIFIRVFLLGDSCLRTLYMNLHNVWMGPPTTSKENDVLERSWTNLATTTPTKNSRDNETNDHETVCVSEVSPLTDTSSSSKGCVSVDF